MAKKSLTIILLFLILTLPLATLFVAKKRLALPEMFPFDGGGIGIQVEHDVGQPGGTDTQPEEDTDRSGTGGQARETTSAPRGETGSYPSPSPSPRPSVAWPSLPPLPSIPPIRPSPPPGCGNLCAPALGYDCPAGFICHDFRCRNPNCPNSGSCLCPSPSPSPSVSPSVSPSPSLPPGPTMNFKVTPEGL